jgi:adenylate kinase
MRLIFLGPPGSGKGTQARLISQRQGLAHIATGDIFREAVRMGTPLGRQAKSYLDQGLYVPDALVNDIIAERLARPDRPEAFVMDGYPRTLAQAQALDELLGRLNLPLTAVVLLQVSDEEILQRIEGRLAKEQRSDDSADTVRSRLKLYHATLPSVIDFYREHGLLREIVGEGSVEDIYRAILCSLGLGKGQCSER